MVKFDGIWYDSPSEFPNLGSLNCVEAHGPLEMIRSYRGLQADFSKLPKYPQLQTGSTFLAADTGNFYTYVASDKTWHQTV